MKNKPNIPEPPCINNLTWEPIDDDNLEAIIELSQTCHAVDGGIGFMFEPENIKSSYLPDAPNSGICAFTSAGQLVACTSESIIGNPGNQ